jgi:cation transport ATPase
MQKMPEESQSQTPQSVQQLAEQTIKLPGLSNKIALASMRFIVKALWRERRKPYSEEEKEKLIEDLHRAGVTDEYLPFVFLIIEAVGKGLRDSEEAHRLDRYLVGGCAILNLVLLQIVASSAADAAIHISVIALAIGLSCTVGSLFFSFFRKNPKRYGKPHSTFSMLAILGTIISATALFWHLWMPAGIAFLITSFMVALISLAYVAILVLRKYLYSQPVNPPTEQEIIYD